MPAAHQEGRAPELYRFSTDRLPRDRRRLQRPAPGDRRGPDRRDGPPEGALPNDLPPQTDVFAPDYAPEDIAEIAQKLRKAAGLPDKVTGLIANENGGANAKGRKKAKV